MLLLILTMLNQVPLPKKTYKKGFTLIEVILSIFLLSFLFAVSVPVLQSFLFRSELEDATNAYYRSLRTAQTLSQSSFYDSTWGVRYLPGQVVVFSGANYASRDTTRDRSFSISSRVSATGVTEVIFSKLYGYPNTTGNINLIGNGASKVISLNERGQINF